MRAQTQDPPAPPTVSAPQDAAPQTPPQASAEPQSNVVIKKESRLVLVDAVVTDKKGNYLKDLTQNDFKVYEDNKEQTVSSFSTGADAATQANGQKRYLILFFDNSTMQAPDQIQARAAANKFIEANANGDHLMAVVDFGGALRIVQNFTSNAKLLQQRRLRREAAFRKPQRQCARHPARHCGFFQPFVAEQCRSGLWCPQHVARGSQPG